jgi:hypothetical protein
MARNFWSYMARYLVTTRRAERGKVISALDAVSEKSNITVINSSDPESVTIETTDGVADQLRSKLDKTHFVEPEIRRSLH